MTNISRREALLGGAAGVGALTSARLFAGQNVPAGAGRVVTKGRLKQSVSRWCYQRIAMPDFCKAVVEMGLTAVDLLQPNEWEPLTQYGLICSMGYAAAGSIPAGLNNPSNHDSIVKGLGQNIPLAAKFKVPNVITFFGNVQPGMTRTQAIDNCVTG